MSFLPKYPGTGSDHSSFPPVAPIIANSITVAVGEAVKLDSTGYVTNATADDALLGIVVGFADSANVPLAPSAYAAGTATSSDVQSVVAASDNQTVAKKRALVQTSPWQIYSVNVSGTLGTTADSPTATDGAIGGWVNVDSAGSNYARVLESTVSRTDGQDQNFFIWGVDPDDTARYLVSIANSLRFSEQTA
jgi:hypothetical protein